MLKKPQTIKVNLATPARKYEIQIGLGTLTRSGSESRRLLGRSTNRIVIVSNRKVFSLYGSTLVKGLKASNFHVASWLMGDGERFKSLTTAQQALQFFARAGLERNDAVLTLGGGVVGDLGGFAAATYLRGIPLIHIPTTLIAQIDSAIGGKTGVNLEGKNLVGAFHQPSAVMIDVETLRTLPKREVTAGWCEAVKHGAIGSRKLFQQTSTFLKTFQSPQEQLAAPALVDLIKAHCSFKAQIVRQDETEDPLRTDRSSRRVLNFGHTIAHALESVTGYRRFRHGEAVGHGMLVAAQISKNLGLLPTSELELLRQTIRMCGPLPTAANIDPATILEHVRTDKKHLGGNLQWILLEQIGRPRIVSGTKIPPRVIRDSLSEGLATAS